MNVKIFRSAFLAAVMLAAAAAPSFAQAPPPGPFGPGGPRGPGGPLGLLSMPEVQRELKLDPAQVDLLGDLRQSAPRPNFQELQNLSPQERQQRFAAMQRDQEKKVAEILSKDQLARLKQLQLQQMGIRAVDRPEVARQLGLTADQQDQVRSALQGEREAMRQLFTGFDPGGTPPSPEERQQSFQKMRDLRAGTEAKLNGILTASQKQQLKTLQGAPFQFPQRRPGGPGAPPNN